MAAAGPGLSSNETLLTDPPTDGISSVCFGPSSDLLLASSWDSVSGLTPWFLLASRALYVEQYRYIDLSIPVAGSLQFLRVQLRRLIVPNSGVGQQAS